jgi:hypothetical protein
MMMYNIIRITLRDQTRTSFAMLPPQILRSGSLVSLVHRAGKDRRLGRPSATAASECWEEGRENRKKERDLTAALFAATTGKWREQRRAKRERGEPKAHPRCLLCLPSLLSISYFVLHAIKGEERRRRTAVCCAAEGWEERRWGQQRRVAGGWESWEERRGEERGGEERRGDAEERRGDAEDLSVCSVGESWYRGGPRDVHREGEEEVQRRTAACTESRDRERRKKDGGRFRARKRLASEARAHVEDERSADFGWIAGMGRWAGGWIEDQGIQKERRERREWVRGEW